jgi:hypothetical protein
MIGWFGKKKKKNPNPNSLNTVHTNKDVTNILTCWGPKQKQTKKNYKIQINIYSILTKYQ